MAYALHHLQFSRAHYIFFNSKNRAIQRYRVAGSTDACTATFPSLTHITVVCNAISRLTSTSFMINVYICFSFHNHLTIHKLTFICKDTRYLSSTVGIIFSLVFLAYDEHMLDTFFLQEFFFKNFRIYPIEGSVRVVRATL